MRCIPRFFKVQVAAPQPGVAHMYRKAQDPKREMQQDPGPHDPVSEV